MTWLIYCRNGVKLQINHNNCANLRITWNNVTLMKSFGMVDLKIKTNILLIVCWQKAFLGNGHSHLFKIRATSFSKGR